MRIRSGIALLCFALVANAFADPRVDQARSEGELVWYTAMNVDDAEKVLKPFRDRHPFLDVVMVRATGRNMRSTILAEERDGRFVWDVASFNVLDIDALAREGVLAVYRSPETQSGFAPGEVDPEGRWAPIYLRHFVLAFNTRLVSPEEAPKSWQDLLSRRWAGRFGMDESDAEWYATMIDYWGRKKGTEFIRALARQEPKLRSGHPLIVRELAAGRYSLALLTASEVDLAAAKGAPLQWVKTLDPIIVAPTETAISAKAPHPAAARLFVDYLLSREGQLAIQRLGRVPGRTDLGQARPMELLKLYSMDPHLTPKLPEYEAEFHRILAEVR